MELKSKLTHLLPIQTGTGKNGQWKKQDIIVETEGQYPKKVCISIWGDKINQDQLQINNLLIIDIEIESREYNGKWYTDVKARNITINNSVVGENSSSHPIQTGEDLRKILKPFQDFDSEPF